MSQRGSEEPRGSEGLVFHGSSPADVSHAGQLWSSVTLHPPLESRLISADIRQRLPVARSSGSKTSTGPGATGTGSQRRGGGEGGGREEDEEEVEERRRRSEAMAVRKEEILGLLWSQRERRLRREDVGRLRREEVGRPGVRNRVAPTPPEPRGAEADIEAVQLLE